MDNETLVQTIEALEVAANTVQRCYTHRPGNFAYALQELETQATAARELVTQYRKRYPHMAWNDPPENPDNDPCEVVRVALDSLHADAAFLCGGLAGGNFSAEYVAEVIRERLDAARLAIPDLNGRNPFTSSAS